MNKQQAIELAATLAQMTEEDFKQLAQAIYERDREEKLAIFETACRITGQAEHALKKR